MFSADREFLMHVSKTCVATIELKPVETTWFVSIFLIIHLLTLFTWWDWPRNLKCAI